MLEVAGVKVPVRLRQQLEQERQDEQRTQQSSVASKVEDAPRLTHKLLKVFPVPLKLWYDPLAYSTLHGPRS